MNAKKLLIPFEALALLLAVGVVNLFFPEAAIRKVAARRK